MLDVGGHDFRMQAPTDTGQAQAGHFLTNHHAVEKVGTDTAVLFFDHGAQEALLTRLQPDVFRHNTSLLPFLMMRYCLVFEEFAHGIAEGFMVRTEQRTGNHHALRYQVIRGGPDTGLGRGKECPILFTFPAIGQ